MLQNVYLKDEALCNLTKISEDIESVENYLKLIRWWMQDTQSLVAVTEKTDKVIGVLIERVLDLYLMKTLSRVMVIFFLIIKNFIKVIFLVLSLIFSL